MAEYGEPLSQREKEVIELVATGATNRQIAQQLVVSVNTVKVHLRNIFAKLGVESRTEATLVAIREGWVSVPQEEAAVAAPGPVGTVPAAGLSTDLAAEPQVQALPPLPWPKRLALVASLLLVVIVSAVTWPRSQTAAGEGSTESDNPRSNDGNVGLPGESTGWHALAPMNTARSRLALVVADRQLLAIGGETEGGITGAVERYDPVTDRWTLLTTSKPTRVSNISAAAIGERIYVPGGLAADGEPTTIVEAFDLANESWEQVAPLPRPRSAYALAVHGEQLYLFGGRDADGYVNTTYVYLPQQDAWQEGQEIPTPRAYAAAATLGQRIFVVGGYDGQRERSTCEVYSPEEDTWDTCEPLTLGRGGLGLAGVANRLYVVGGGWSNYLGFSEEYDPARNSKRFLGTPVSRQWRNLALASTTDRFYVAGGWNGDYLSGVWEYVVLPFTIYIPATSP